jgi:hypothetical protein
MADHKILEHKMLYPLGIRQWSIFYKDRGDGVGNMKEASDTPKTRSNPKGATSLGNDCLDLSLKSKMRNKKRERWCDFMCVFTLAAAHVIH